MHLVYTGSTREEVADILGVSADRVDTLLLQSREITADAAALAGSNAIS